MNKYSVVCPDCGRVMRVKNGGFGTYVLEMADSEPHFLWMGSLYDCAPCDKQVVARFGEGPVAACGQDGFADCVDRARTYGTVIEVRT